MIITVDEFTVDKSYWRISFSLFRARAGISSVSVMDVLTKWAGMVVERLDRTFGDLYKRSRNYGMLIGFMDDLKRRKFYIGTYPENTYALDECLEGKRKCCGEEDACFDLFFDEGSPLRYLYGVKAGQQLGRGEGQMYLIEGISFTSWQRISIIVNVFRDVPIGAPVRLFEELEAKASDENNLYFLVFYPRHIDTAFRRYVLAAADAVYDYRGGSVRRVKVNTGEGN